MVVVGGWDTHGLPRARGGACEERKMDDDVKELLKTWELPNLIPLFEEQQITIEALSALNLEDLKDLIPQIGPRVLFTRCWRSWKQIACGTNNNSSFSGLDLSNFQFDLDSHDLNGEKEPLVVIPLHECPSETQGKENTPILCNDETLSGVLNTQSSILENLLKQSLESSSLLAYKGSALDGDSSRNLLASIIAKEILNVDRNSPIVGQVYFKWTKLISELFPGERSTTYFIPACTTASGVILQARGKLVHQVLNKRRRLQQLGTLQSKKRTREESPGSSSSSPRPLPACLTSDTIPAETIERDLLWLKNSTHPWELVQKKWKETAKHRIVSLHQQGKDHTIETYINTYPALKKPEGYSLLLIDFEELYKEYTNNLYSKLPLSQKKIIDLLIKRKSKDAFCQDIIGLSESSEEEHIHLSAFLAIPYLLNTTAIKKNKRVKQGTEGGWKPSKAETCEAFIKHVKSDAEIGQVIELRLKLLKNKGVTPQPYLIIVGESLREIKTFLVVVNSSVIYQRPNILQAIDTCYKAIWSLNIEYGCDSYAVWYFIQRGLYKMTSEFDRGSTSAESLLTDCNL